MEAKQPTLESFEQILRDKPQSVCKGAIEELSQEEQIAILDALFDLLKKGTPSEKYTQLLATYLSFCPQKDVFNFFQRIKTSELLRQFCSFFDKYPEFYCLVRISNILLTKSENDFLIQILMILNEKQYLSVPIGIQTLNFLENEINSPRSRETTIEDREKNLNFCRMLRKKLSE